MNTVIPLLGRLAANGPGALSVAARKPLPRVAAAH